jgi:hypothetical protein
MNKINSLLKEPVLHFLLAGTLLYITYHAFNNYLNRDQHVIVVSNDEIQMLVQSWTMKWNRPPTAQEKEGMIKGQVREKVLYKTAVEMGLDKQDVVTRRRLAQQVELLGAGMIQSPQPSEADLVKYYEDHKEEYRKPETVTITQVFFDPDKRGDATLDDAKAALNRLNSQNDPNSNISAFGDMLMLPNYLPNKTEMEISRQFGSGFTASVFELEAGKWHGPVLSGYGTHLVFVHNHEINELPEYTKVRDYLRDEWMAKKKSELEEQYVEGLMARYEVVIEN